MKNFILRFIRVLYSALALCLGASVGPAYAQHVIVGIDNKVFWDAEGKLVLSPPGKDAVAILDIGDRLNPRLVASLPLMNSVHLSLCRRRKHPERRHWLGGSHSRHLAQWLSASQDWRRRYRRSCQ